MIESMLQLLPAALPYPGGAAVALADALPHLIQIQHLLHAAALTVARGFIGRSVHFGSQP